MIQRYDPALFSVQRATVVSSRLGEFVLGQSGFGVSASSWVTVPLATFDYAFDYDPDVNGTLIIGSEAASVSLSFKGEPSVIPLYPADRIRARYDGQTLFTGTVDSTSVVRSSSTEAGHTRRVDFSASIVGTYATALTRTVCFGDLPQESAITRIRRWVTVSNWDEVT